MLNTISIYCKNNHKLVEVPIGSSLLDIYEAVDEPLATRPMNAQVNNKTEGLSFRCWQDKDVEFIDYSKSSGQRTYVRFTIFFPQRHSISSIRYLKAITRSLRMSIRLRPKRSTSSSPGCVT